MRVAAAAEARPVTTVLERADGRHVAARLRAPGVERRVGVHHLRDAVGQLAQVRQVVTLEDQRRPPVSAAAAPSARYTAPVTWRPCLNPPSRLAAAPAAIAYPQSIAKPERAEDRPEDEHLRRDRSAGRVDELRQEGEKEQRDLGVQQLHDDRLPVGAGERDRLWRARPASPCRCCSRALSAEEDQIGGAQVAQRVERGRRGGDQRREPRGGGRDVDQRARQQPQRRREARPAPLAHAPRRDVDHVRPRNRDQRQRGQGEQRERGRRGHRPSVPAVSAASYAREPRERRAGRGRECLPTRVWLPRSCGWHGSRRGRGSYASCGDGQRTRPHERASYCVRIPTNSTVSLAEPDGAAAAPLAGSAAAGDGWYPRLPPPHLPAVHVASRGLAAHGPGRRRPLRGLARDRAGPAPHDDPPADGPLRLSRRRRRGRGRLARPDPVRAPEARRGRRRPRGDVGRARTRSSSRSRRCAGTRSRATSSISRCGWRRSTARRPRGRSRSSRRRPGRRRLAFWAAADRRRGPRQRRPAGAARAPARAGGDRPGGAAAAREARAGDDHAARRPPRAAHERRPRTTSSSRPPRRRTRWRRSRPRPAPRTSCTASPARARPRSTCARRRRRSSVGRG